jgi:calcineurin-like phosphoesterase family protein
MQIQMKVSNQNILFTSDNHFFHKNIIKYCNRPFVDAEEMNETLITNWNNKVGPNDTIFHLGDFGFGKPDKLESILKKLNGNIYLIKGNHDHTITSGLHKYFAGVYDMLIIQVPDKDRPDGWQYIHMMHYPMMSWDRMSYGAWQLHGHKHSIRPRINSEFRFDVGVDAWNYSPVSYNEIKQLL